MIQKSLAMRGLSQTFLHAVKWPFVIYNERNQLAERNAIQATFDRRYGTDTCGILPLSSFRIAEPNWVHGVRYAPTSPQGFRESLSLLGLEGLPFQDFAFVDVGSGKGATLLYAADLGFRYVAGVELVPELHEIAVSNIAKYPAAAEGGRAASFCMDAIRFQMPDMPLIVFMNYPFSSREMMRTVTENIGSSGSGPKYLIAVNYPYDPASLAGVELRLRNKVDVSRERTSYAFEVLGQAKPAVFAAGAGG